MATAIRTCEGHLRNVDESVLFDSDVNEGSESCDVGDYARKHHTLFEVFNAVDVRDGEKETN